MATAWPGCWLCYSVLLPATRALIRSVSLLGRHKMIPHISPGKTWEGLGGAVLGAVAAAFALSGIIESNGGRPAYWCLLIVPLQSRVTYVKSL